MEEGKVNQNLSNYANDLKNFYAGNFKDILSNYFRFPLRQVLNENTEFNLKNSMILYLSVFIFFFIGIYFLSGNLRNYNSFFDYIKFGIFPIIIMINISIFTFLVKSIFSTNISFQNETSTGALVGIPLSLIIPLGFLLKVFGVNIFNLFSNFKNGSFLILSSFLFIITMIINTVLKSLKNSNLEETKAFYFSIAIVCISIFVAISIG